VCSLYSFLLSLLLLVLDFTGEVILFNCIHDSLSLILVCYLFVFEALCSVDTYTTLEIARENYWCRSAELDHSFGCMILVALFAIKVS
jgi:hypothetical protein